MPRVLRRSMLSIVAFLVSGGLAQAGLEINFEVRTEVVGGVVTQYAGTVMPFPAPDQDFVTGRVFNADNSVSAQTVVGGWAFQPGTYGSLGAMITSLEQPWQILLDEGLPSERTYSMQLDLGTFPSDGFDTLSIDAPAHNSVVPTLTPSFALTSTANPVGANLSPFLGPYLVQTVLPGGASTWAPGLSLSPGVNYVLDIYSDIQRSDIHFTVPIDANEEPLPDWQSRGFMHLESVAIFSVVPEPATAAMLGWGAALIAATWMRTKRSS